MKGRTRITLFWDDERIKICECFPVFHYVVLFRLPTLTVVRYLLCFTLLRICVHMTTSSFFSLRSRVAGGSFRSESV